MTSAAKTLLEVWTLMSSKLDAEERQDVADVIGAFGKPDKELDRLRDLLGRVRENVGLRSCARCGHLHMPGHVCYECGYDPSEED